MATANRSLTAAILVVLCLGCSAKSEAKLKNLRETASQAYAEGLTAFDARDYATAEEKFSTALQGGLDADQFCFATAKRAVCWGSQGKYDEALAELDKLGLAVPNPGEIFAARSFILKKQGKAADANAAMAKARQFDRMVKEFQ